MSAVKWKTTIEGEPILGKMHPERNAYIFVCRQGGEVKVYAKLPKTPPACPFGCGPMLQVGPNVLAGDPPPHPGAL